MDMTEPSIWRLRNGPKKILHSQEFIQTALTVRVAGRIRQGVCRDSGRGCRGRRGRASHFSSAQADSSGFHFPEHRHGNA